MDNDNSLREDFSFCPTLQKMILSQTAIGSSGRKFEGLAGLSSVNTLLVLRQLALRLSPRTSIEIGLSFGGSCLAITSALYDVGALPERQHIALDPFQESAWDNTGLLAVQQAELDGYLDFRLRKSSVELPRLLETQAEFDLAYIDGSHLFENVFVDFYYVARLLSAQGVVVFDDSSHPHVRKVIRFIQTNFAQNFAPFSLDSYRADGGKSFRYRVGGLLGKRQLVAFQKVGSSERSWDSRFSNF